MKLFGLHVSSDSDNKNLGRVYRTISDELVATKDSECTHLEIV